MIINHGQLIRDASGNFSCPNCWRKDFGVVNPTHTTCPKCGVELEWPEDAVASYNYYTAAKLRRLDKTPNLG